MLINWEDLTVREKIDEILDGLYEFEHKKQIETAVALIVNEYDIDLRDILEIRKRMANINGNPLDHLDEHSGELVLEDE